MLLVLYHKVSGTIKSTWAELYFPEEIIRHIVHKIA